SLGARAREEPLRRGASAAYRLAAPHARRAARRHARLERSTTLGERERRERPAAVGEEIERDERRRRRRGVSCARRLALGVHAPLERLKAQRATSRIERDDLAVQHERTAIGGQRLQGANDFRELRRLV